MSFFMERVKRGAKAFKESFGPKRYMAAGIEVTCPHCKNNVFKEGSAQLNTATSTGTWRMGTGNLERSAAMDTC